MLKLRDLAQELQFYVDLLAPSSLEIVHLPSLEVDPYRGLSPHPEHLLPRAPKRSGSFFRMALKSWLLRSGRLPSGCTAPERFLNYCLMLKQDEELSPDMIREYLFESGYVEDDPVTDPGEFSLRGGILDIFPPHLEKPVRLEFFGDRIESIRAVRSRIPALRGDSPQRLKSFPCGSIAAGAICFTEWAEKAPSLWSAPFLPHLEEELALARQGEMFPAFEFLLPAVDPLEKTLFDYLHGYRIITVEREVLENTLARHHAELYERFLDRVEAHKPVLSPEQIYVTADEFHASLERLPAP